MAHAYAYMKKKDLHTLVHALSPAEKKFFKEYASGNATAEKNYVRLFDAIAAQKEFDDDVLKKQFKAEKFVANFHVAKAYLFDLLLEALTHMEVHQSSISRYRMLMNEALILFNKNLFDLALDRTEKAREICNKLDWPLLKTEAMLMQLRILNRKDLVFAGKYFTEVCYPELMQLNKAIEQQLEIRHLHKKVSYTANSSGRFRTKEDEEMVTNLLENELITQPDKLQSFDTILAYYSIMAYYHWLKNDFANAFEFEEKKWTLFNNYPERVKENTQDCATLLYNLTQISFAKFWEEKARRYLKTLENLPAHTKEDRLFVRNKYVRACFVHLRVADRQQHKKLQPLLEPLIKDLQSILPQLDNLERLRSLYEAIVVLMRFEKYSEAIDYIQQFVNEPEVEELRPIHYPFVRLFLLICHYELGNYDILLSMINNASYALKKKNKLYHIEQLFFRFFKKLLNTSGKAEQKKLIAEMGASITTIGEDPYEKTGLDFLGHVLWFEKNVK